MEGQKSRATHTRPFPVLLSGICQQSLPVQVESCDLSIVSLKVNEIEEILGRLLISLLSRRMEGIRPWTQAPAGSLRGELQSMAREKGRYTLRHCAVIELHWPGAA